MNALFWCIIGFTLITLLAMLFFPEQMAEIFEGLNDEF